MSTLSTRFTLQLPEHWTPEQALAVYELPLIQLFAQELDQNNDSQLDLFDFDDSIPF